MADRQADEGPGDESRERRLPAGLLWALFILSLLAAAALLTADDPWLQMWGFVLLFSPLVLFGLIMAAYYWRSRRMQA